MFVVTSPKKLLRLTKRAIRETGRSVGGGTQHRKAIFFFVRRPFFPPGAAAHRGRITAWTRESPFSLFPLFVSSFFSLSLSLTPLLGSLAPSSSPRDLFYNFQIASLLRKITGDQTRNRSASWSRRCQRVSFTRVPILYTVCELCTPLFLSSSHVYI